MRTNYQLGFGLVLAGAVLGSGCGSDRKRGTVPEDPLATFTGFCEEWGKRACTPPVVEACLATDAAACAAQQAAFCISVLPRNYASDNATVCLDAVGAAYADAKLTAREYGIVIDFAAPCDKLIEGPGQSGATCRATPECNTLENLVCVFKPGETIGTCQVPVVQGGGRSCVELFQLCEPGFHCNGSNCVESRFEGQACSAQEPCGVDLNCNPGSATCVAKGQATDPCSTKDDCVSKICAKSGTTETGVCAPQIVLSPADLLCANLR